MEKYFLILLQVVLFYGFIWSALKFFVRKSQKHHIGQLAIKVVGGIQIFVVLGLTIFENTSFEQILISTALFLLSTFYFYWTLKLAINNRDHFNFAFSESNPKVLFNSGPYRYIRHPFYFSYIIAWIGSIVITNFNLFVIVASLILIVCYFTAAIQEEREFLLSDKSGEYLEYISKSWRFLPFMH
jgi:protein-S-isoprenylcysteine O-methyltransferase Ste14